MPCGSLIYVLVTDPGLWFWDVVEFLHLLRNFLTDFTLGFDLVLADPFHEMNLLEEDEFAGRLVERQFTRVRHLVDHAA